MKQSLTHTYSQSSGQINSHTKKQPPIVQNQPGPCSSDATKACFSMMTKEAAARLKARREKKTESFCPGEVVTPAVVCPCAQIVSKATTIGTTRVISQRILEAWAQFILDKKLLSLLCLLKKKEKVL